MKSVLKQRLIDSRDWREKRCTYLTLDVVNTRSKGQYLKLIGRTGIAGVDLRLREAD